MNEKIRKRKPSPNYSATEKCQAVLSVWTERCRPTDVCREMGISAMGFQQWQNRALEGMMQAMEVRTNLAQGAALSPRLQALLRKRQNGLSVPKIEERLARIQEMKGASSEKNPRKADSEK